MLMNNLLLAHAATEPGKMGIVDAGLAAVLGYAIVFLGLIALMVVVMLIGKSFVAAQKRKTSEQADQPAPVADEPVDAPVAPGSAGQVMTFDVPDKTAAMLMAIVADKLNRPLNELRFISIKEVK